MSLRTIVKIAIIGTLALIVFAAVPALYFFLTYYHSLEEEVVTRFSQKHWNIPSRIYSDSTVIYPGLTLKDVGFFERLARLNYHRVEGGKVAERGEYSYDDKSGKLVIFPAQLLLSVSQLSRRDRCDRSLRATRSSSR